MGDVMGDANGGRPWLPSLSSRLPCVPLGVTSVGDIMGDITGDIVAAINGTGAPMGDING